MFFLLLGSHSGITLRVTRGQKQDPGVLGNGASVPVFAICSPG